MLIDRCGFINWSRGALPLILVLEIALDGRFFQGGRLRPEKSAQILVHRTLGSQKLWCTPVFCRKIADLREWGLEKSPDRAPAAVLLRISLRFGWKRRFRFLGKRVVAFYGFFQMSFFQILCPRRARRLARKG